MQNINSEDNYLENNINNNINLKNNQNNNDFDKELEIEEPITEIYNNQNAMEENNYNLNNRVNFKEKENKYPNYNKQINDSVDDVGTKKRKNTTNKNNKISNNNTFNNQKNSNKIIIDKQKNELINKEYNEINNNDKNSIKINNFVQVQNPQTFNFFNILSKPSPIKPPQNMNKNKNITNKNKSKDKNIFQRLFKEAQYQRIFPKKPCHFRYKKAIHNKELLTLIEGEINKKRKKLNLKIGNKTSNNYGEYLYEMDRKHQEEKEKKIVLIKQQKYQEEKKYFTFKPIINNNNKIKNNIINKDISYEEKRMVNNSYNYNNNINKYFYMNNNEESNLKSKEKNNKNTVDKKQKSKAKIENNNLFYNSNKQSKNKQKIPYDKNRNNNICNNFQQLFDLRTKTPISNSHIFSSKSFSNKSLNNNSNSVIYSEEENKNIFINLFNSINNGEKEFISGYSLNMGKIPKNILVILNPIIKELLKNKNRQLNKEDFISCMNELFNNISSVDKRLIIYTYKNKHNKSNSLVLNSSKNNFSQIKIKPETPDYSWKNKYNYYYNNDMQKMPMNNLKNNFGYKSSKTQKKIEEFLYGDNSNFYHGF